MNEECINKIRQKTEHYEADVPGGLYDDIQREMMRRGLSPMANNTRKARISPVWTRRMVISVASAAAVVLTGILVFTIPNTERQSIASLPTTGDKQQSIDNTTVRSVENNDIASLVAQKIDRVVAQNTYATTCPLLADNYTETSPILYNKDTEPECEVVEQKHPSAPSVNSKPSQKETKKGYSYPSSAVTRSSHQIAVGAYVQGMQGDNQYSARGFMCYDSSSDPVYGDETKLDPNANMQLPSTQATDRTHHKLPVKGGISLRYAINDRWSVQTGINYSYHSSELERGNQEIDQRLHFIGIPVAVGYNVWSNRKINVYVAAGGEVEKMVKGRRSISYTGQHREEDVKMSRPQLSAQLSAGAEYRASNAVSVYVEPNVSYHFDNGSDISTIYKDKPLELGLSMGVRFTIDR